MFNAMAVTSQYWRVDVDSHSSPHTYTQAPAPSSPNQELLVLIPHSQVRLYQSGMDCSFSSSGFHPERFSLNTPKLLPL